MLKKLFLSMMAIAVLGLGFVACSDDDDEEEEKIVNTYKYENLYGRTFSWTGKTQSGSDMTQYITITDANNVSWEMISGSYPHSFNFSECVVENTTANTYKVTGKYTFNGTENSAEMIFTLSANDAFNWNYNSKDYEGFAVYEPLKDLYGVAYSATGVSNASTVLNIKIVDAKTVEFGHGSYANGTYYYKLVKTTVTSGDATVDAYKTVWYKDSDLTEASGQTVTFSAITAGTGFTANIDSGHGASADYSFTKTSSE